MTNMAEGEVLGPTGNRGISSVTFGAEVTGSLASHQFCEFPGKVATFPSKMASVHSMWPATVLVGHTDHQVRGVGGDFRVSFQGRWPLLDRRWPLMERSRPRPSTFRPDCVGGPASSPSPWKACSQVDVDAESPPGGDRRLPQGFRLRDGLRARGH